MLGEYGPQGLSNTAWAYAKLQICDAPFLDAIAADVVPKLQQFQPQNLSNTSWAFAALHILTEQLMDAIAEVSVEKIAEFDAQAVTNIAWSYAKLSYIPPWALNPLIEQALSHISEWGSQNLSGFAWSMAALSFRSRRLMHIISEEVVCKISDFGAQDLSNTSWAYARLSIIHYQMLNVMSEDAVGKISQFNPQNLSNTVWSYATLEIAKMPLMNAIAACAIDTISEFSAQNLGNTVWAFAVCTVEDQPLMEAIAALVVRNMRDYDLKALSSLADLHLSCNAELQQCLDFEISKVWHNFPKTYQSGHLDRAFTEYVKQLGIDNLGSVGDRLLMQHMCIQEAPAGFEARALETMIAHCQEDLREDPAEMTFGGPSKHKRVFSYAEYRICFLQEEGGFVASRGPEEEGALLQENGARGQSLSSSPLTAVPLPINHRVQRSACSEFLLLSELCALLRSSFSEEEEEEEELREDSGEFCKKEGTLLPAEALRGIQGTLRLYSTGPSCMSCMVALWQFRMLHPLIRLEVSYATASGRSLSQLWQVTSHADVPVPEGSGCVSRTQLLSAASITDQK